MNPLDPTPEDWMGPLRLIGEQRQSSWPAIERSIESLIRAGDQPRVLLLYGVGSIVDEDVRTALKPHAQAYSIEERRIPLTDPAAVVAALCGGNVDANLVAIVRGGGDGLSALSDRQVINAVAYQMPVTIVSAVGHEVDQPLIQDLVYWAFSTPTALGTWLAARATGAFHARAAVASGPRRELEGLRLDLQKSESALRNTQEQLLILRRRMRRTNALLLVTLGILAVILVTRWAL